MLVKLLKNILQNKEMNFIKTKTLLLEDVVYSLETLSFYLLFKNYLIIELVVFKYGKIYSLCEPFKISLIDPCDIEDIDNLVKEIKWTNNINFYNDKEVLLVLTKTLPKYPKF